MSKQNLSPYIRATNKKYGTEENGGFWGENGYNCIEVGYLEMDDDNNIVSVTELTPCADVVDMSYLLELAHDMQIAIDCIGDSYLRLFSRKPGRTVRWQSERIPLSNMSLIYGTPMEELREED
jgi:hypothetical protein